MVFLLTPLSHREKGRTVSASGSVRTLGADAMVVRNYTACAARVGRPCHFVI